MCQTATDVSLLYCGLLENLFRLLDDFVLGNVFGLHVCSMKRSEPETSAFADGRDAATRSPATVTRVLTFRRSAKSFVFPSDPATHVYIRNNIFFVVIKKFNLTCTDSYCL
jgi:hypothetical protein